MTARKKESTTALTGSDQAKRIASVILEVFAGLKGPVEAAETLGISANRYYQLEARGLQGMIDDLEPRNRGRQLTPEREIEALKEEVARRDREISRLSALVRTARRTMGIPERKKPAKKAATRQRKPSHRGKKVVAILRRQKDDGPAERAAS